MNVRLKISPVELVTLNIVLSQVLADNPAIPLLRTHLGNVLKNIKQKREDLPELNKLFLGTEDILSKTIFVQGQHTEKGIESSNWGFDDNEFMSYFNAHQSGCADKCLMFEHRVIYTILGFADSLFSVEIKENNETSRHQFSAQYLRFLIHKYGKDAFSNLNDFEQLV